MKIRLSFRLKTILGIALIQSVLIFIHVYHDLGQLRESHYEALSKRASSVALLFAAASNDAVLSSDLSTLESIVDEVMKNPGVVYAQVLDRDGEVMAERGAEQSISGVQQESGFDDEGHYVDQAKQNITEAGVYYGQVRIGLRDPRIQELISEAKSEAAIFAIIDLLFVGIFAYFLASWLAKQVRALDEGARRVCDGALGYQIPVMGDDELGRTAASFNSMSNQLGLLYDQLESVNEQLLARVEEQSSELHLLYRVLSVLEDLDTPIEDQLQTVIEIIDEMMPQSSMSTCQIKYNDKCYSSTAEASDDLVVLDSKIQVSNEDVGSLEMGFLLESVTFDDNGRVKNKDPLLGAISQAIGTSISHRRSMQERQLIEIQLRQSQKLESVGQLAAGIAHEINTPTQFVSDNTSFLKDAFADISRLLEKYKILADEYLKLASDSEILTEVHEIEEEIDIGYLNQEIPVAIDQSIEGLTRVSKIVRAMKQFAHPGGDQKSLSDINAAIETTIDVSRNEWKYVAKLTTDLDAGLPHVDVYEDEFNQVILNMIVNAAHAIEDANREKGLIHVATFVEDSDVVVEIRDNGMGMPEQVKQRIFDPFFTTKEVGRGSGQGLAIAYSVIVDKHKGSIGVDSVEGEGTAFKIRLPLKNDMDES